MEGQTVLQFGGGAAAGHGIPCRHAISFCVDADVCVDRGTGVPYRAIASVALTWDDPALVASDPTKDARYYLWGDYDDEDDAALAAERGAFSPTGMVGTPWPLVPHVVRRVTAAARRVGPAGHLWVSRTVMVAADPVVFVADLMAGYIQLF